MGKNRYLASQGFSVFIVLVLVIATTACEKDGGNTAIYGTVAEHWDKENSKLGTDLLLDVLTGPSGKVWIASGAGVFGFNLETWSEYSASNYWLETNRIRRLAVFENTLLITSLDAGLLRLNLLVDGVSGASSYDTVWTDIPSMHVNDVLVDGQDQWIATARGLALHQGRQTRIGWETYENMAWAEVPLSALCLDNTGSLWAAGDSLLLQYSIPSGIFSSWPLPFKTTVNDLTAFNEEIIIATNRGLIFFDTNEANFSVSREEQSFHCIISRNQDSFWTGTESGLYILQGHELEDSGIREMETISVNALYDQNESTLWCATDNGLYEITY